MLGVLFWGYVVITTWVGRDGRECLSSRDRFGFFVWIDFYLTFVFFYGIGYVIYFLLSWF